MIVPITIGSGIRMKILEACSLGIPFVSTSVGAEGIPVVDGENCYIADTPEAFIDKLQKMRNPAIQKKFVENSRNMVLTNYSKEALRKSCFKERRRTKVETEERILANSLDCSG